MTSLKTSIKTITYLSDIGCLEIQGASLASKNDACNNSKSYKRPEISQVIGFMSDTAYSIYLKKWQSKYYHQIQIKKKTNNNHNQVVHNITSL